MNDTRWPAIGARIRTSLAALGRQLEAPRHQRLATAQARVRPSVAATRGAWLLLADGRPALLVRRPR